MGEKQRASIDAKAKNRLRWVLFGLVTPLFIYLCGQVAWTVRAPLNGAEIRPSLTADYSPWAAAFFPGLDPQILKAAIEDREERGLWYSRRSMSCFLLSSACELSEPTQQEQLLEEKETETPLRIANDVEPDLNQPDGQVLMIQPGKQVVLDLREAPILVTGSIEPETDVVIYTLRPETEAGGHASYTLSLALRPEDAWVTVFNGEDQVHGDSGTELPYSIGSEAGEVEAGQAAFASADLTATAVDVDASIRAPGLYGWLRIAINPEAEAPLALDAVVVTDGYTQ